MEFILGKTAGFCGGVKTAVEKALNEKNVYCLGELVHNKQVNEMLKENGIIFIDNISKSKGKTIIRTHGVEKNVYEYAKKNNIELLDLTCPNVIKIHKLAEKYSNDGYYIILTGKPDHPENIGTVSYCNRYSIVENIEDIGKAIEKFENSGFNKLLLISQTTYDLEKFYIIREKISYALEKEIKENKVKFAIENTICQTTQDRQEETKKLSKEVDCMIIIGGKNSSNTKKLYEIAEKNCKNVIWIEDSIDIKQLKKIDKIGIMAGASTPNETIKKYY